MLVNQDLIMLCTYLYSNNARVERMTGKNSGSRISQTLIDTTSSDGLSAYSDNLITGWIKYQNRVFKISISINKGLETEEFTGRI